MADLSRFLYNVDIMSDWHVRAKTLGYARVGRNWRWDMTSPLIDYDLIVVRDGCAEYECDGEATLARPGTCVVLRKGRKYLGQLVDSDALDVVYAHFDYVDSAGRPVAPPPGALPALARQLADRQFVLGLLGRAVDSEAGPQGADLWLKAALAELLKQDARPRWTGRDAEWAARFEDLAGRVRRDPGARWRVPEMARPFHCTRDHFARLFRKFLGQSPGDFVVQARIESAMALLRTSALPVGEIARRLGYGDIYTFSRQFREKTGAPPTSYRRQSAPM